MLQYWELTPVASIWGKVSCSWEELWLDCFNLPWGYKSLVHTIFGPTFLARRFLESLEERGLCFFSSDSSLLGSPNQHRRGQSWAPAADDGKRRGVTSGWTGQSCGTWWTRGWGRAASPKDAGGWGLKAGDPEASHQGGRGRPGQGLWRRMACSDWSRLERRRDWSGVTEAGPGHCPRDWGSEPRHRPPEQPPEVTSRMVWGGSGNRGSAPGYRPVIGQLV